MNSVNICTEFNSNHKRIIYSIKWIDKYVKSNTDLNTCIQKHIFFIRDTDLQF